MPTYRCKTCGHTRGYEAKPPEEYPFCCQRCKLIDLGKWFNGDYVIDSDLPGHAPLDTGTGGQPPT